MRLSFFASAMIFGSACLGSACAHSHASTPSTAVLDAKPHNPVTVARVDDDDDDDDDGDGDDDAAGISRASELLDVGFQALQQKQLQTAHAAFSQALLTGELNEAGRALCYWHMCACQTALGHIDAGRNALADFISTSEDVLARLERHDPSDRQEREFAQRFGLVSRLDQARALMSSAWAQRVQGFGRSPQLPIRVHSEQELLAFLSMAPACKADRVKRFLPQMKHGLQLNHLGRTQVDGHIVNRIDVACHSQTGPKTSYYFERVGPQQPTTLADESNFAAQ